MAPTLGRGEVHRLPVTVVDADAAPSPVARPFLASAAFRSGTISARGPWAPTRLQAAPAAKRAPVRHRSR